MKFIAIGILLVALSVLGWISWRDGPPKQDLVAETWTQGRGVGRTVKLFTSGRYESSFFCDVCPPNNEAGTWRQTEDGIQLESSEGKPTALRSMTFRGCRALVVEGEPQPRFPGDVFFPESERCGDAL